MLKENRFRIKKQIFVIEHQKDNFNKSFDK